jgi:hypothetical protein
MAKYININEKWRIKVDEYNYQLMEYRKGGTVEKGKFKGNVTEDRYVGLESYHPNLQQALCRIIELQGHDVLTEQGLLLHDYVSALNDHKKEILSINFKITKEN